ncbi:MAG: putative shikimate-kinase [Acidimicrobiaceae bacterium]|nr:putative shikimate-kinase [Acidimicrobiaceae bacterium]
MDGPGDPGAGVLGRIFLIGMMGSGKSAIGTSLASLLGLSYLDNDAALRRREGRDLLGLAEEGAQRLHDAEAAFAEDLTDQPGPFVAGIAASVVERPQVMADLARSGLVVYLRARPETLAARVAATARPFVGDDPLRWTRDTLARRADAFEQSAGLVLDTDGRAPREVAEEIADRALGKRPRDAPPSR